MEDGRLTGTVKWFNAQRGYGFIECQGKDYFVNWRDVLMDGFKMLEDMQQVSFKPKQGTKGMAAEMVKVVA